MINEATKEEEILKDRIVKITIENTSIEDAKMYAQSFTNITKIATAEQAKDVTEMLENDPWIMDLISEIHNENKDKEMSLLTLGKITQKVFSTIKNKKF